MRWVEVIQTLEKNGVTTIVECGPGKVLTGLIRRIDDRLQAYSMADPQSLEQALQAMRP